MNQYGSVIRTLTARNVIEKVIAPPADLLVATTDCIGQIFEAGQRQIANPSFKYYVESNIILHRLGVFSNFADGMVWKTPYSRMGVRISFTPFSMLPAISGTVTVASNSKALTGDLSTLFVAEIPAGTNIMIGGAIFTVALVTDNQNAVLTDYAINAAGVQCLKLSTPAPTVSTLLYGVENFNTMYEHEAFVPISTIAGNLPFYFITATPVLVDDSTLMTRTIDPSYGREIAYFDVKADFEFSVSGSNI